MQKTHVFKKANSVSPVRVEALFCMVNVENHLEGLW